MSRAAEERRLGGWAAPCSVGANRAGPDRPLLHHAHSAGAYMCEADAKATGTRAAKDEKLKVRVTVVIGDRDQVGEAALREIFARLLPHATFRVVNGVGHLSPLGAPDAVADTRTIFLDRL
jgi:pimeloyl-ACP methyl ester carboxylesterase